MRKEIVVEAPIERAFSVFTEDFDRIKPRDHNMLAVEIAESVFEHRNLERHGDGWEGTREGVGSENGWPLYLQRLAELLMD